MRRRDAARKTTVAARKAPLRAYSGILSSDDVRHGRGPMSDFLKLTPIDGIDAGTMRQVDLEGHEFLVARVGDDFLVTDARCAHLGGHLARGVLEGSIVTCPLHHSQYDLRDGSVLRWTDWTGIAHTVAALARHPRPIRAYECKVEDGALLVGPQKACPPVTIAE
jgi:3-phenylpropionate/trans-cinnamate dioxygenase ferredoxin subunit